MPNTNEWHLSKSFSMGLLISIVGLFFTMAVAWANTQRDILDNKERIEELVPKVTAIYEGLLIRGIIEPIR